MAAEQLRVLVVDDNALDRALWRHYLTQAPDADYDYAEESFGEAGLSRCDRFSPDCVVLDLNLPDMNGLEFLSRLQIGRAHV